MGLTKDTDLLRASISITGLEFILRYFCFDVEVVGVFWASLVSSNGPLHSELFYAIHVACSVDIQPKDGMHCAWSDHLVMWCFAYAASWCHRSRIHAECICCACADLATVYLDTELKADTTACLNSNQLELTWYARSLSANSKGFW